MKVFVFLILSTMIPWQASAAENELSLKQQFEQVKSAAYSKWTEKDRKEIGNFLSNVVHVFAAKIAKERKVRLEDLSLEFDVPAWATLKDVSSIGYMKAVDMIPYSQQANGILSGKNQLLCKIVAKPTYLTLQINLAADCVQSGAQWDLFEVRGEATIKKLSDMSQTGLLQDVVNISNFKISISSK